MGEVYRAHDTKLGRDVALKILPESFVHDPDRVARFRREAQVLASLNHPHIAAIYGLEEANGSQFLVLELVEGGTLADRLKAGPLPVEEALTVATQIADALEVAHEKGIVHRDLKPANIAFTGDGQVKVLDFGLAKALEPSTAVADDMTASPTITTPAMTEMGMILGTAAYMSPEQAKGRPADKRSDIWAFGCVLYEMLVGQRAFEGEELIDTFAFILTKEPDWTALPSVAPASIRRLLHRTLEKDRKRRLADVADARLEIDEASRSGAGDSSGAQAAVDIRRSQHPLVWFSAGALAIGLVALIVPAITRTAPRSSAVTRTVITLPDDSELDLGFRAYPLALSPDGVRLVYVAENDGRKQLYRRELGALEATPLAGTTGARHPFFSPDGEWVAFFARGMLQKVSIHGGAPLPICPVPGISMGGTWGPDGRIVFGTLDAGLFTIASTGGTPKGVPGSDGAAWPEILPDAKTVLFTSLRNEIATISIDGSGRRIIAHAGNLAEQGGVAMGPGQLSPARFVPTGHLVFGHGNFRLRAVPFDLASLSLTGAPVSIVDAVYRSADSGPLYFAISKTGVMVYAPEDPRRRLVWVERDGRVTPIGSDREAFRYPAVSPDGTRIAVDINTEERRSDIWIYDVERGTKTRLTSERSSLLPLWSRDGRRITFNDPRGIIRQTPEASGNEEIVLEQKTAFLYPTSWSPDGRTLLFTEDNPTTGMDLWVLSVGSGAPRKLLARRFNEWWAQFSRDGQWVAYMSDESGTEEVYVAHYPDMANKVIVSTHGGDWPLWSPESRELFYRQGNAVMAAPIQTSPALRVGIPQRLFSAPFVGVDGDRKFDVTPDARRFLMIERVNPAISRQLVVVQNWQEGLKQHGPTR
jgi:Tol biopolymer transport system component